jgi:hypothetical protein
MTPLTSRRSFSEPVKLECRAATTVPRSADGTEWMTQPAYPSLIAVTTALTRAAERCSDESECVGPFWREAEKMVPWRAMPTAIPIRLSLGLESALLRPSCAKLRTSVL